jgi:hypothetical protein
MAKSMNSGVYASRQPARISVSTSTDLAVRRCGFDETGDRHVPIGRRRNGTAGQKRQGRQARGSHTQASIRIGRLLHLIQAESGLFCQ